uniref:Heat shock 70 kDa protein 4 n=1 Tax=Anopheles coluzzii TaxID=1518534 RepID=A0A8W7PCT0_ANOCL
MSVIGIDFGNDSSYVAVAKAGGIETIANDYSLRATPSFVAFAGRNRVLGVAAKNQQVTNMNNTIGNFKELLGRKFDDPRAQEELRSLPYHTEALQDGGIGIRVNYLDEEHVFSPEQITAMLFTKLKEDAFKELKTQINDCVITVPSYFTNAQRQALLDAANISGLNVLRLMNETTATALSYGFYKQDLPAPEEKPRNVIFVDCGHASLQVSACAFHKGNLKMLASCSDSVGGRDFDLVLATHFNKEFQTKYKIDASSKKRAFLRLMAEVEKLKKNMSANSTKLPLNIECFMNEIDVHSSMQRSEMEELSSHLFKRIETTMRKLLLDSKLALEEIHSVEIVGGSSRIPAIKHLIEQIFGKPASTTLNQDEAVSRGAALQCAILSPAVRVREFSCTDVQAYPVLISWTDTDGPHEMKVFEQYHAAPFCRLLTVHRKEPMTIKVHYEPNSIPYPDPFIGTYHVKGIKPDANGEAQEVKVKVRINNNGIITVSSATMYERKESEEPSSPTPTSNGDQQKTGDANQSSPQGDESGKVGEPMDIQEMKMIANDRQEKERIDARNALEEQVYEIREKIQEDGALHDYIDPQDASAICRELEETENWLYEEGESCEKGVYKERLEKMRAKIDPVRNRCEEFNGQEQAFTDLGHAVQQTLKAVEQYRAKEPKYEHLTETEMINITEAAQKAQKWYEEARSKLVGARKTEDPPVKLADIRHETVTLTTCTNSVLNRPKPKPPTPPADQNQQNGSSATGAASQDTHAPGNDNQDSNTPKQTTEDSMDVE